MKLHEVLNEASREGEMEKRRELWDKFAKLIDSGRHSGFQVSAKKGEVWASKRFDQFDNFFDGVVGNDKRMAMITDFIKKNGRGYSIVTGFKPFMKHKDGGLRDGGIVITKNAMFKADSVDEVHGKYWYIEKR